MEYIILVCGLYIAASFWFFYLSFTLTDRSLPSFFLCLLTGIFWPLVLGWYLAARISGR